MRLNLGSKIALRGIQDYPEESTGWREWQEMHQSPITVEMEEAALHGGMFDDSYP
jgi:hypothetical protein